MGTREAEPQETLAQTLRNLGAGGLELLRNRLELAALEYQEQRELGKQMLLLGVAAAVLLALGLLLLALFVVALCWDSHRLAAIAGLTLLYGGGGVAALLRLRWRARRSPEPFAATLHELAADVELLRRKP